MIKISSKKFLLVFGGGGLASIIIAFVILIIPICAIVFMLTGEEEKPPSDSGGNVNLSAEVLAYEPIIKKYADEFGIPEFTYLLMAVMMQESGGRGLDPMQSSECPYNTVYPNSPGAIQNPDYSIWCGVQYVRDSLTTGGCLTPTDIPSLSLALQGYNYGNGYISWAKERGGYTKENALEFSLSKRIELGWAVYGDPEYVDHVLRYFTPSLFPPPIGEKGFALPLSPGTYFVSQWYSGGHTAVDLAAGVGVPIFASASGTVEFAGFGDGSNGFNRYGNVLLINHNNGYYTLYAHCNELFVAQGQQVTQGQNIAAVGDTGQSFGAHLHFEIRSGVQSPRLNPADFINFE